MDAAKDKAIEEGQNIQQESPQLDEKDKHRVLIEALSLAVNVTGNQCFDHHVCTENHPGGSRLQMELEQRWNDLVLATTSDKVKKDHLLPTSEATVSWLQKIYALYTEPRRHYHTVVHLWEMFDLLDIVIAKLSVPKWYVPMAWSVFFHDAIYDPKSNRNEKDSAELFRGFVDDCMADAIDKKTFSSVLTMILATEKHKVILPREVSKPMSEDEKLEDIMMQKHFLDVDMAVLGKQRDSYMKYAALIRKEYEFVPHDVYCRKRAEILESFLDDKSGTDNDSSMDNTSEKNYIYLTESFGGAFEDRARENLRNEINLLRNNTIPG